MDDYFRELVARRRAASVSTVAAAAAPSVAHAPVSESSEQASQPAPALFKSASSSIACPDNSGTASNEQHQPTPPKSTASVPTSASCSNAAIHAPRNPHKPAVGQNDFIKKAATNSTKRVRTFSANTERGKLLQTSELHTLRMSNASTATELATAVQADSLPVNNHHQQRKHAPPIGSEGAAHKSIHLPWLPCDSLIQTAAISSPNFPVYQSVCVH
jgi:hypothetical protein